MKRKGLLIISICLLIISLVGCGKTDDDNTFKVGMEAGYAPFNWTQEDGSNGAVKIEGTSEYAGGYDVEIAKRIAKKLGKELVIVKTEWDGLLPALTSGTIDAVIAGMSPTKERMESIDFTESYYDSNLVMVVKKGSKYENVTSIKDFKGAKITGQLNTFHYDVIDQIDGVHKETAMSDFPAMRVALESGIIDGYVSERPEGISASSANENLAMVEFQDGFKASKEDTSIAVGLKKGSDLTKKINDILSELPEEERIKIMDDIIMYQPISK
ncbi:transporter substrate-binding domain-containing protein [Wansuia hejianensis]|uniref:Transporter substrate-binding domain-containing protein n=1 Tax=Wansuia hejianensis TaxID=2763667 RepID=A0A926EX76_9FIRM|nr:transporter substrate-binding domain-containing protein [Wansuia hejianensis]MBC8590150.1 transporter substrate-binding domain-containing protein [Wansuia hejianensis]